LCNDQQGVLVFVKHEDERPLELSGQLFGEEISGRIVPAGLEQQLRELGTKSGKNASRESVHTNVSPVIETRPDAGREQRKGAPEVIFGETKETAQIIAMAHGLLAGTGRAIISRLRTDSLEEVKAAFQGYTVRTRDAARTMVIYTPEFVHKSTGGHVGVISAGTSDIPVAEEAATIVEEMGCRVTCIYDVGVAGLHRLISPLQDLFADNVDAIIVAAGMDGALPSVVAGLAPVPVIGLPTSIGYGMGGKGVAALLSMLQTCAPGLSVVNIDNGVGAGITAALIANRVAQARERQSQ
jgi:pyridinium-3,5-biscarboxylic acid mononucleotide synthase